MATRIHLVGALVLSVFASSFAIASELSDSMQLYFDGRVQQALQNLNHLASSGSLDARVYYFRGLANHRLGQRDAANADFQKAAALEVQTGGAGVGQALQRVQGAERLMLEKHRTMARLRGRQRRQPMAPRPAVARAVSKVQEAPAMLVATTPRFRLASEVPLRSLATDRYASQPASGLLAKDEKSPAAPTLVPSADKDEAPVGTGVVQASNTSELEEEDPFADGSEDFASEDDIFSADDEPTASSGGRSSSGLFGAFRAIGKALTPKVNPAEMVPNGIPLPGGPGAGGPGVGGPGDDDSAFGDDEDFPFE